jgi:hypothetical protein
MALCRNGARYEGYVDGLGYVYWHPVYLNSPVSGMPSQTPYNTPRGSKFTTVFYEMVVIREEDKIEKLLNIGAVGATVAGIEKTAETMSEKKVTVGGGKYVKDAKGTVRRNPNRKTMLKSDLARKASTKILLLGIGIDWLMFATGNKKFTDALINTSVNGGIFTAGYFVPEAGVALGIAWLLTSWGNPPDNYIPARYEDMHGLAPQDNTRVFIPDYQLMYYLKTRKKDVIETKQYFFKQGQR